jgi:hypothetical protein
MTFSWTCQLLSGYDGANSQAQQRRRSQSGNDALGLPAASKCWLSANYQCPQYQSSYWRNWLRPEFRCLVPATSFCEWTDSRPKVPHWFALDEQRTPFAFAGIWRPWTGERKGESGEHRLFAFLTTEPNDLVRPIHEKAMPVILSDADNWETWLTGSVEEALVLARQTFNPPPSLFSCAD